MKKIKALSAFLIAGMAVSAFAGCGGNGGGGGGGNNAVTGEFDYSAEMLSEMDDVSTGYNSNLFYVNTLDFEVADPSVIFVTEGKDKGYFYAYGTSDEIGGHGIQGWRSKDLCHWECTGVAFMPDYDTAWAVNCYWAPEVIYDNGVYYMFYNAFNIKDKNRLCLSVARSTTPDGPFVVPDGVRNSDGKMLKGSEPVFDVTTNNPVIKKLDEEKGDSTFKFARDNALDASPFIDPVTKEKYLYFSYYNDYGEGSFIYGMKMKDWLTPDYGTLKIITCPGYTSEAAWRSGSTSGRLEEGGVNEGPFMVYENGKYYMTFSVFGYMDPRYRVKQAVSDSPLGDFEKISEEDGGIVISSDTVNWNHIVSAGHHSFVQAGDEMFIAYHTFKNRNSINGGRALAVDRVVWTENSKGLSVMHTNGPTYSVQALPEAISGYKNIAPSATVTANNTAEGSDVKLLTDGMLKYQEFDLAQEYEAKAGTSTVKLEWNEFKTVRGLMVYNSYDYDQSFYQVRRAEIEYKTAGGSTEMLTVDNLKFDWDWNCEQDNLFLKPGGAVVAEFDEMPVKSITLTIQTPEGAEGISIGEIVVLGKDTACAGVSEFKEYSYTNAEVKSPHVVKDSKNFGSIENTNLKTTHGYDLSKDDGSANAVIKQRGVSDQFAYFKDVYATEFYIEAEITVPAEKPYPADINNVLHPDGDPYPKFGIVISCDDDYKNKIFYFVDAVGFKQQVVGCAQRNMSDTDWDWNKTEQNKAVDGLSYTDGDKVKMAVLRKGAQFYFICNDKVVIEYNMFSIFNDAQKATCGFLSFNTPMDITNYSASADAAVIAEKYSQYVGN